MEMGRHLSAEHQLTGEQQRWPSRHPEVTKETVEGRKLDDAIITLIFNHYGIEMHKIGKNRESWERPMFNI